MSMSKIVSKDVDLSTIIQDKEKLMNFITTTPNINVCDAKGRTLLHFAVNQGNVEVINNLLENGADCTLTTCNGNTPLHIAAIKGNDVIMEKLLYKLKLQSTLDVKNVINTKTGEHGSTPLHLATNLDTIHVLLKYGAFYNIENKKGETPVSLSKDKDAIIFLNLIDDIFHDAVKGNPGIIEKILNVKVKEMISLLNTSNVFGLSLLQVLVATGHGTIARSIQECLLCFPKENVSTKKSFTVSELESLKSVIEFIAFNAVHINSLKCGTGPFVKECYPWKMLKEGSYFLGDALRIVDKYKLYSNNVIDNEDINIISNTIERLQFDPNHISTGYTMEAYEGKAECFVSKGQGKAYYNLLHSKKPENVRLFLRIVEEEILTPARRFLEFINKQLNSNMSSE